MASQLQAFNKSLRQRIELESCLEGSFCGLRQWLKDKTIQGSVSSLTKLSRTGHRYAEHHARLKINRLAGGGAKKQYGD